MRKMGFLFKVAQLCEHTEIKERGSHDIKEFKGQLFQIIVNYCTSLSKSKFSDFTLAVWNYPCREYSHDGN